MAYFCDLYPQLANYAVGKVSAGSPQQICQGGTWISS